MVLGSSLLGAAAAVVALAVPAGAVGTAPANNTIVGAGSQVAYGVINQLGTLFNESPGCPMFVPFPSSTTPQNLDYECTSAPTTTANAENPYNDVVTQQPPLGSSNGIQELEDSGAHAATANYKGTSINVDQDINFATSSRAYTPTTPSAAGDLQGLNFVAYAKDGVDWLRFKSVNLSTGNGGTGTAQTTPSAIVPNLTQTQLEDIYNGTYTNWHQIQIGYCHAATGNIPGVTPATPCDGAGPQFDPNSAPIIVVTAPEGAGVQSNMKGFLGFDPVTATNVNCLADTSRCYGPLVIFQNELTELKTTSFASTQTPYLTDPQWTGGTLTNQQLLSDAIFYYSYGEWTTQCAAHACGAVHLPTGTTAALGKLGGSVTPTSYVDGLAPSEKTVLEGTYALPLYLYNVYSNGSNPNIPVATPATLNFASELGFICKPSNATTTDPNTQTTYETEIQAAFKANGYFGLSAGASTGTVSQTPFDEYLAGGVPPQTAGSLLAGTPYAAFDPVVAESNGDPSGFCQVYNTDGNSTS